VTAGTPNAVNVTRNFLMFFKLKFYFLILLFIFGAINVYAMFVSQNRKMVRTFSFLTSGTNVILFLISVLGLLWRFSPAGNTCSGKTSEYYINVNSPGYMITSGKIIKNFMILCMVPFTCFVCSKSCLHCLRCCTRAIREIHPQRE
jgi:hypothetical protein